MKNQEVDIMSIMDKFKENASNALGNERVGEIEGERDGGDKAPKAKRTPKPKSPKRRKEPLMNNEKKQGFMQGIFKKKEKQSPITEEQPQEQSAEQAMLNEVRGQADIEEDPSKYIQTDQVGGRNRAMILKQLDIQDTVNIPSDLVTPEQIENVEFTVSLPSGLDADEVSRFCDIMESAVRRYRTELMKVSKEKELLIDEILRGERLVLEQRNQEQLNSFLEQGSSEKEKLRDNLIEAQQLKHKLELENERLKQQLSEVPAGGDSNSSENEKLRTMIAGLQAKLAEAEQAATNSSSLVNNHSELTDSETAAMLSQAEREKEELRDEIEQLRATLDSDSPVLQSTSKELELENEKLQAEVARMKKVSKISADKTSIDSPEDYEKRIMEQFNQGNGKPNKHVRTQLSAEDIANMKEAQESGDITIKGFENVVKSGDSNFDDMMKELNI